LFATYLKDIIALLRAELAALKKPPCTWTEDVDGYYEASCGESWDLIDGDVKYNHYRFCPGCGGEIIEKKYEEVDDDE